MTFVADMDTAMHDFCQTHFEGINMAEIENFITHLI